MSIREVLSRMVFSLWYYFRPPWDTGVSPPELLNHLEQQTAGKALDLGCGTGTNAITMAQRGWQVIAVDYAPQAIRMARRKARSVGVSVDIRRGDVTRLEGIHGPFDLILDIGCYHSLEAESRKNYLNNLRRLLAPEGTYLLYANIRGNDRSFGPGISEDELELPWLHELNREYGTNRRTHPSAWFTFRLSQPSIHITPHPKIQSDQEPIDG